jgi:thiosulfate/3-mercaptopyruvate sulfurtransferase
MTPSRDALTVAPDALSFGVQLLDVRWGLTDAPGSGLTAYRAGHIPGARFCDLEAVLTGPRVDPLLGRHPLPDAARLASGLGALDVDPSRPIVVYDVPGSFAAGRAWWVLRWAGLSARVLDGGWPAWLAAGGTVEIDDPPTSAPTEIALTTGHLPTIDADQVVDWPGTLIDVRAPERFRGDVEPMDPKAGHIPGAVNRPVSGLWDTSGRLPNDATLRTYFGNLTEPVAAYCGSGVSAAQGVLALAALGVDAALYPPSWSGWSADPSRPVAVGD